MINSNHQIIPTEIKLRQRNRVLVVKFDDGAHFDLPCEYLRVYSPAAEVRTLMQQGKAEVGKEDVNITNIEPMGNYAVRLYFDDGHDTGVYSWDTLYELGKNYEQNWNQYLQRIAVLGYRRDENPLKSNVLEIKVLYFVSLVQLFGKESEFVRLPLGITNVKELLAWLGERGEKWAKALEADGVKVTINKQFVELDTKLHDQDEVAIVPTRSIIVKR